MISTKLEPGDEINSYRLASNTIVEIGKKPKTEDQKLRLFKAHLFLANHYYSEEQWLNAQQYAASSLKSAKLVKGERGDTFLGRAHGIIGKLHDRLQEYPQAKSNYDKAIKLFEKWSKDESEFKVELYDIFERYIMVINRLNGAKVALKILLKYWSTTMKNAKKRMIDLIFLSALLFHSQVHVNDDPVFFDYLSLAVITPFLEIQRNDSKYKSLWKNKMSKAVKDGYLHLRRIFELDDQDLPTLGKEYLSILSEMAETKIEDVDHFHLRKIFEAKKQIIETPQMVSEVCQNVENDAGASLYVKVLAYNEAALAQLHLDNYNAAFDQNKLARTTLGRIKKCPAILNTFLTGMIQLYLGRIHLKKQEKAAEKVLRKALLSFEKQYLTLGYAAITLLELSSFAIQKKSFPIAQKNIERVFSYQTDLKDPGILGRAHSLLAQVHYHSKKLYYRAAIEAGKATILFSLIGDDANTKFNLQLAVNFLDEYMKNG